MRDYEIIVIFGVERVPELTSTHIDAVTDRISQHNGEVNSVHSWGRRKFAYAIKRQREGHYVLVEFSMDPADVGALENSLRISEDIMRFLVVREDEDARAAPAVPAEAAR
ncbi:MAG: 30S ribosomal protein S6 [Actinobacteria bacterium]|nr:30S ribosomal protein S6 [Actinomycetota bacterium]